MNLRNAIIRWILVLIGGAWLSVIVILMAGALSRAP